MSATFSSWDLRNSVVCNDFAGHRFHVAAVALALMIAPLGIVGGELAFGLITAISIARCRVLWPVWMEALRSPVTWLLGTLLCWIFLSLLWSPDPLNGLSRIQCMRALLWAPLLYPLMRDAQSRIPLLMALLAGITILSTTQMWQWANFVLSTGLDASSLHRFGGLHGEVGKAGMWSAAGVCIGVFLCTSGRLSLPARIAASIAALCCLGGVYACATLRALGGATVGLVACSLLSTTFARAPARDASRRAWVALPVLIALAGFWMAAERRVPWTVINDLSPNPPAGEVAREPRISGRAVKRATIAGATGSASTKDAASPAPVAPVAPVAPPIVTTDPQARTTVLSRLLAMDSLTPRVLWWKACWHSFTQSPVVGAGWGASPTIVSEYPEAAQFVAEHPRAAEQHPGLLTPTQPHSLYFMTMGELGAIGLALVLLIVALVLRDVAGSVRACAELGGPAAATIMWFVAAGGDTVFNSAVFAAGAIFMAFAAAVARDADSESLSALGR